MKKKSSNGNPSTRPFSPVGTVVIGSFIFFFMLLPGGLIIGSGIKDIGSLTRQTLTPQAVTGAGIAVTMGLLLFATGMLFLWKTCLPRRLQSAD